MTEEPEEERPNLADTTYVYAGVVGVDARAVALEMIVAGLLKHLVGSGAIGRDAVTALVEATRDKMRQNAAKIRGISESQKELREAAAEQYEKDFEALLDRLGKHAT